MTRIIYKPLVEKFNKYGYTLTLIKREKDVAIFKQHKGKKIYNYEVIVVGRHDGYELADTFFPPSEFYPSSNEWGSKGFTCQSLDAAENRFNALLRAASIKADEDKKTPTKVKSKIKKK